MKSSLSITVVFAVSCTAFAFVVPCLAKDNGGDAEVMSTFYRLFDAMRAGDGNGVLSVFHPMAGTMLTVDLTKQIPSVSSDTVENFAKAVGTPHADVWDERIWNAEVRVEKTGNFSQAWMEYAFYAGKRFSHCGVDAAHLVRGSDGTWLITYLGDTRRVEGCERAIDATADRR